jgi:MFS family permease
VILSRQQARLLLPLGVAVTLSLTGDLTLYAVLPNQTEVVGISLAAVGVMLGANRLVRIPGNLLAGSLNDRLGRRKLFLAGLFLGILATFSYSLVYGFWPLLAGRVLWGVAWALINVGGYTMVLEWSEPADRGRMTGFYQAAYMIGLSISPILGGALTDALGFRAAVRIDALISAVGLAVAFVALPDVRRSPGHEGRQGDASPVRTSLPRLVRRLRKMDRRILLASLLYLLIFFVSSGVLMSTISLYLEQRWGPSISLGGVVVGVASLAGLMLALRASLGILGGPVAGIASDRLHNRWPVVRGAILLGIAGFVVLTLPIGIGAVPLGVLLVASGAGALIAVLAALVGDLTVGNRAGITYGSLATAGDIGSASGPLLAYALAVTLDLRWVYLLCALALATGLAVTIGQGKEEKAK